MVKFYESTFAHTYPFPTVTLAYYLRYPNPYSTHVISTDVINRHYDPESQTLYTARLHLKRSKIPSAILKLLPSSLLGPSAISNGTNGTSQSYVLERSIVSMKDGVMVTESRNLELTGILTAVERQLYRRPGADAASFFDRCKTRPGFGIIPPKFPGSFRKKENMTLDSDEATNVNTKVELYSRLGQLRERFREARMASASTAEDATDDADASLTKPGFFKSWSTNSMQRSIESIGLRRTERAIPKSKQGLEVVLSRLKSGGIKAVFDGMRRDMEALE